LIGLPAGFSETNDFSTLDMMTEANTAHLEAAKVAVATTADTAAIYDTSCKFWTNTSCESLKDLAFAFLSFDDC
jgi:hypothetical protein